MLTDFCRTNNVSSVEVQEIVYKAHSTVIMSTAKRICDVIGGYFQFKQQDGYYDENNVGEFEKWADDNGYDTEMIEDELGGDADDCTMLDFIDDFPTHLEDDHKNEFIFNMLKIYRDFPAKLPKLKWERLIGAYHIFKYTAKLVPVSTNEFAVIGCEDIIDDSYGIWWADREQIELLLSLAGCSSIFGLLVLNMRRAQSSLRLHELGSTLNDFRFILFTLGLLVVIIADQLRYAQDEYGYLWAAHSLVWFVSGMLWCTIDFAPYMSYFVSTAYHIFIFIATSIEFAKVCVQMNDPDDNPRNLYKHNNILYTLYDFKIDGLLLMLMVEISTIITLIRDRKREWYCFGLSHVYRYNVCVHFEHGSNVFISDFDNKNVSVPMN